MLDPKIQAAHDQYINTISETGFLIFTSFFCKAIEIETTTASGIPVKLSREEAIFIALDLSRTAITNLMNMPRNKEEEE